MDKDTFESVSIEAEKRYNKYRRRVGGQAVTEKDGPEYWYALVAYELGKSDNLL